jgi:glycosidase
MPAWISDAVFYHIYPLGYCGAPAHNDFSTPPEPRLRLIEERLDGIAALGANALYLGPVFESVAHGYDTVDHRRVDRRLGSNEDLAALSLAMKARGLRLVLDGVFNHVGREHPWFRDLLARGREAAHLSFFKGIDFARGQAGGDPFGYEDWNGCRDLVRLDLGNPELREELIGAVLSWIEDYDIDGLRLDTADLLDLGFLRELARRTREKKSDFWLMGEVIHGDYRSWAPPGPLDSVTNYECWKGLWSSLKDGNYHEIAWSLRRQQGEGGLYRGLELYNFADNHDVDRAASLLPRPELLYPLYCLLFTMPGIPSVYYGSEYGLRGRRSADSDSALRPGIEAVEAALRALSPSLPAGAEGEAGLAARDLAATIAGLAALRRRLPALRRGEYRELYVAANQFAFLRRSSEGYAIVVLNASPAPAVVDLVLPFAAGRLRDDLEAAVHPGRAEVFEAAGTRLRLGLHPHWARVLVPV